MDVKSKPLIAELPTVEPIRLPVLLSAALIAVALLAFFLHGTIVLGYSLGEPYIITTLLQVAGSIVGFGLILVGRMTLGVRLFVLMLFLTVMMEPYVVSSETLVSSLLLLPPRLIALVIASGLVFSLHVSLALAVLASANTAVVCALSAERAAPLSQWILDLIPVASVLVLSSGLILFLWMSITRNLLDRSNALLRQRELLVQETNHRVKNSLQLLTSVLDLQRRETDEQGVAHSLSAAASRIRAVAAVHQALHVTGKESDGELYPFLERLVEALRESLDESRAALRLDAELGAVRIRAAAMVPVALILNELVTNAVQHGLAGVQTPEVRLLVRSRERGYSFTVRDNGRGLPKGFDLKKSTTLGFTLVHALAEEQLEGTLEVSSGLGASVTVTLPRGLFIEPPEKRG
ncbi:MAG: sensor histidine kinase [Spirochaetaceae bacterium]